MQPMTLQDQPRSRNRVKSRVAAVVHKVVQRKIKELSPLNLVHPARKPVPQQ